MAEESSDDDTPMPMPESLKRVFEVQTENKLLEDYTKSLKEQQNENMSLFTKVTRKVDSKTTSDNLKDQQMSKA